MMRRLVATSLFTLLAGCLVFNSHDEPFPCQSASDCASGERCLVAGYAGGGRCYASDACFGDSDCTQGQLCKGSIYNSSPTASQCYTPECTYSDASACGNYGCVNNKCLHDCSSDYQCSPQSACVGGACVDGVCSGKLAPCSSLADETSCGGVAGCAWTSGCSGVATACGTYGNSALCNSQSGCYWSTTVCVGIATSCAKITYANVCQYQNGCSWTTKCTGTPTSCSAITSRDTCKSATGCTWGG